MIGNKESPLTVAVWFHTSALIHSALLLSFNVPRPPAWPSAFDWLCLVLISISSFLANIFLNRGFQIETAALVSSINYLQVVYAHIIGLLIFNEQTNVLGVIGAMCIAIGVLSVARGRKNVDGAGQSTEARERGDVVCVGSDEEDGKDGGNGGVHGIQMHSR